jgi:hypothetical protein
MLLFGESEGTPLRVICELPYGIVQWKWGLQDYESITKLICNPLAEKSYNRIYHIAIKIRRSPTPRHINKGK